MGNRTAKSWKELSRMLVMPAIEPSRQIQRILAVERDVVLPVKMILVLFLFFSVVYADLYQELTVPVMTGDFVRRVLGYLFVVCSVLSVIGACFILAARRLPLKRLRFTVAGTCLLDNLLLAFVTCITGGFDSTLFWVFLGLLVRNALSVPLMIPQLLLQLATNISFVLAGVLWFGKTRRIKGWPSQTCSRRLAVASRPTQRHASSCSR